MQIGEALRSIRLRQGRTLESVALEAGFDTANLSRLERGEQTVSLDRLIALAAALRVKSSDLLRMIEAPAASGDTELKEVEFSYGSDTQALNRAYGMLDSHHRMIGLRIIQELVKAQRSVR